MRKVVCWLAALCAVVAIGVAWAMRSRARTAEERAATPSVQLPDDRSAPSAPRSAPGSYAHSPPASSKQREVPTAVRASVERRLTDAPSLRKPLVDAIREPNSSAEQRRRAMLDAIEASGSSDELWTEDAEETFENWRGGMPASVVERLTVGSPRCFRAGCIVDIFLPNQAAYDDIARAFRMLQEPAAQHGGRVQTPAVASLQGLSSSWIMLRPESAERDGV